MTGSSHLYAEGREVANPLAYCNVTGVSPSLHLQVREGRQDQETGQVQYWQGEMVICGRLRWAGQVQVYLWGGQVWQSWARPRGLTPLLLQG